MNEFSRYIELCKLSGDCHARLSELHHQNLRSFSVSISYNNDF